MNPLTQQVPILGNSASTKGTSHMVLYSVGLFTSFSSFLFHPLFVFSSSLFILLLNPHLHFPLSVPYSLLRSNNHGARRTRPPMQSLPGHHSTSPARPQPCRRAGSQAGMESRGQGSESIQRHFLSLPYWCWLFDQVGSAPG